MAVAITLYAIRMLCVMEQLRFTVCRFDHDFDKPFFFFLYFMVSVCIVLSTEGASLQL